LAVDAATDALAALPDAAAPSELAVWNARARAGAVTETLHGVAVDDPYRGLETEGPDTTAWLEWQTARSRRWLEAHPRPGLRERLAELLSSGVLRRPAVAGGHVFYTKREGEREQFVLMTAARQGAGWGPPRELLDPSTVAPRTSIDWYFPSPRGRYVAYGLSQNGDERSTLRVLEVATGRVLTEALAHTKWCRLAWLPDETGFYYTRFPREGEAHHDNAHPDAYWRALYLHRLGSSPDGAQDTKVYEGAARTDSPDPWVSSDGRWLVVHVFRGWSRQDAYLLDRRARVAAGSSPRLIPVAEGTDTLNEVLVHRGRLYLVTNRDAPRYRVLSAPVSTLTQGTTAPAPDRFQVLVPEGPHPLESVAVAGGRLVLQTLEDIVAQVRVCAMDGTHCRVVTLPGEGAVQGLSAEPDQREVAFVYTSFLEPPTVLAVDAGALGAEALAPEVVDRVRTAFDPSPYVLERERIRSRDGTPVNVFYMHRRDLRRDGNNPVLVYGYGGFNISLAPSYLRDPLYWLERGGVYAVANLRGGAEFGEAWHRGGALGEKERVFEDFEAVLRWFTASGISQPSRIGIHGASNGGLLMGAMLTRAPDAFGAAAAYVGLYDMVRFHRFPPAELWTSEYGSPDDPTQFGWLYRYSPYHQVRAGTRYPAAWIETADHDTRVFWGHSAKFAARLQDAQAGDAPVLFYLVRDVGHGAGTQRTDQIDKAARMFTFLEGALHLDPAPGASP
jgi:prolyl oligopeptidase